MSYQLFRPDRFICEQELSSFAFDFKGPTVEFTNPATASGIAENTTIPGRYYLAKTIVALTTKPGLKKEQPDRTAERLADFDVSWTYGCPHRCVYCQHVYLCKNYPYIALYPRIEEVENAIRDIASGWQDARPFVCEIGRLSDMLALEHLTGWLSRLILLFANEIAPHGQLYFLTKSANSAPLLELNHRRATRIGVALTTENRIRSMEPGTANLSARLNLLSRAAAAGYPLHLSFSPVVPLGDYQRDYANLFGQVARALLFGGYPETLDLSVDAHIHFVKPECELVVSELAPHALEGLHTDRTEGRARLVFPEETRAEAVHFLRRMIPPYLPPAALLSIR